MAFAVSLLLAALRGFAIHRGSVCMVRGVAEVLSTGRAYMLLSFGKSAIWVLIVTTPVLWLVPSPHPLAQGWSVSVYAFSGGFLFGIGAAVNRGCAFSTLGRLGNGEVGAMLTLGGFACGWVRSARSGSRRLRGGARGVGRVGNRPSVAGSSGRSVVDRAGSGQIVS